MCAEGERKSCQKYSAEEKLKKALLVLARQQRGKEKVNKAMAYQGRYVLKLKKAIALLFCTRVSARRIFVT